MKMPNDPSNLAEQAGSEQWLGGDVAQGSAPSALELAANVHVPVLLNEVLDNLILSFQGTYVDATFGRGGHCSGMLQRLGPESRIIGLDRDPEAILAGRVLSEADNRLSCYHACFSELTDVLAKAGVRDGVQGILMDIGVSSPQLDQPERGFSFSATGPLDMRMDPTRGKSAREWLNDASEDEISAVLRVHGEERHARRIARAIVAARPLWETEELANLVEQTVPKTYGPRRTHPATKTFQAIRIFINDEDVELQNGLEQAFNALAVGGRLGVISFHSLEDRVVKHMFRALSSPAPIPRHVPIRESENQVEGVLIGKPIRASDAEQAVNPRSRSATLRVIEKAR